MARNATPPVITRAPSASQPAVVINADDLGRSPEVNQAILSSFERGLVSSATIMANMPSFADACVAIDAHELHDHIGVHLNLTEGQPLSSSMRGCPRFCSPDGQLRRPSRPLWLLSSAEAKAVETELRAQVEAVLAAGIRPSHLDSHHHVHTQWPISTIVMRVARRYGIPAVRLTRNCGPGVGLAKRAYKGVLNARLARAGLAATRHFGSARDVATLTESRGPVEIMVHPSFDAAGRLIDLTDGSWLLQDALAQWQAVGTLVTYREIATSSPARGEH